MTNTSPITVAKLASHVKGRVIRGGTVVVERVADLDGAHENDVAYVDNKKFFSSAATSSASCLLIPTDASRNTEFKAPALIETENPKLAFAFAAGLLHPRLLKEPSVHETAVVAETADLAFTAFIGPYACIGEYSRIGANTRIEAGAVVGMNVTVGSDCLLHPSAVLYDGVSIGNNVILHAGVCVGADGFGYVRDNLGYHKFPQIGTVVIEDDVELGAHTCVDRAALGQTRIGRGTKIDNLVHVGHNCDIGQRVVIAAQTGISGSVVIEDDAVIGGQVGFGDHTRVQSGAVIGSKAGILPGKIVRPGVWWGIPVQPLADYKRMNAHLGRLPQMREEIKKLRHRIEELEEKLPKL
ncbi:MAG: UDP-3-O-(3-hydroxymyristoyl)glucosamine N-acyltransferase [Pyrinomonadaceae bacterium]